MSVCYSIVPIFIGYTILLAFLLKSTEENRKQKYYRKAKFGASLGFLIAATWCAAISGFPGFYFAILPSMVLCMVGDICMANYQTRRKKSDMLLGIITFLMAHIGFLITMFWVQQNAGILVILVPCIMLIVMLLCSVKFHLKYGSLRIPAFIYGVFVSTMMAKALQIFTTEQNLFTICIVLAGVLFFASDFSILFLYFYHYKERKNKRKVHVFNLITYYYGMFFFALSILFL